MATPLPYASYDPTVCLNCKTELDPSMRYCPRCRQRNRDHNRSSLEWVREGLSNFLQLEGKTWNTLRDLPIPGKVVRNYLDGQRERYLHPMRLLLFSSLFFFAMLQLVQKAAPRFVSIGSNAPAASTTVTPVADTLSASEIRDGHQRDVPRVADYRELPNAMRDIDRLRMGYYTHDKVASLADSFEARGSATSARELALLDSFRLAFSEPIGSFLPDTLLHDEPVDISSRQLATLGRDELLSVSGARTWYNRLFLDRMIKVQHNGEESLNSFLVSNVSWAVLLFVPLLALGYFALYGKRLPYYSQHLSLAAFIFSMGLILSGVAVLLSPLFPSAELVGVITVLLFYGYIFMSELRVYQTAWWKVLLKGLVLGVFGLLAFSLALAVWFSVALLLH